MLCIGTQSVEAAKNLGMSEGYIVDNVPVVPRKNDYEIILSYMALCTVSYREVLKVLKKYSQALCSEGELHIFVPSLDWAAKEIMAEKPSKILEAHLHGLQTSDRDVFKSSFTMLDFRFLLPKVGIDVVNARVAEYGIGDSMAELLWVSGIKNNSSIVDEK